MKRAPPAVDVRRLYTRFILLVVVPAVGLVSFGVLAISNERAAVEKRFADEYGARLRTLAEHLAGQLEETASLLPPRADVLPPLVERQLILTEGELVTSPPMGEREESALLLALRANLPFEESVVTLVPVSHGPALGLYALMREGEQVSGFSFSHRALTDSISRFAEQRFPSDRARFQLVGPKVTQLPSLNPVRRLFEELTNERSVSPFPSLPLPGALSDWRIEAVLPGGDPIGRALMRNRTVYIVALTLFYAVIGIGVVVTLRGIWNEVKLSRLKTDFVSNVSHELRTPLTSIRLFAETLREGRARTKEEQDACLDFIVNESERLSELTERALDWARLEAGRRTFDRAPLCPSELARSVADSFLSRGHVKPHELRVAIASNLPEIAGDHGALEQVLLNLLENAVKYSRGEKRIELRVSRVGRRVVFEVEDNGIGIARSELRRVFDRFYRSDDLLARRTEGTGLGLSIARRIVEAHGGRISVRSVQDKGSTFSVAIPMVMRALA